MVERGLLRASLAASPAQPATALWRAVELGHLLSSGQMPVAGRGLDLGCGDGSVAALVGQELGAGWELVGVDADPEEVALAQARGVYTEVLEARAAELPLADASVDFVFSNSVLEHIEELEPALDEVARVLRAGGAFVFTVPGPLFHFNLGRPGLLGFLATGARSAASYRRALDRRLAHVRYLSAPEWRTLLRARGLEVVHESTYLTRRETTRWARLSDGTAGLLVRLPGAARRPIDVQRRLGLRCGEPPSWLRLLGRALGEAGALGLGRGERAADGSCLLMAARKESACR